MVGMQFLALLGYLYCRYKITLAVDGELYH